MDCRSRSVFLPRWRIHGLDVSADLRLSFPPPPASESPVPQLPDDIPQDSISEDDETRLLHRLRGVPELFAAIRNATGDSLQVQQTLRSRYDADLVRAALSVHDARQRAAGQLPSADRLWLTRTALEQATAWEVARHRARRFGEGVPVHDLCCGIGVDAAALATRAPVTAWDMQPAMCVRCRWNVDVWSTAHPVTVKCEDVTRLDWTDRILHIDPDRRAGRARPVRRLELYHPPLAWLQHLVQTAAGGSIKLGPAANFLQKFPGCEIELISVRGECREATVWFGGLASDHPFRATVLPSGETLAGDPLAALAPRADSVGAFLFDPDPAVVRSGLIDRLCEDEALKRLDAEDEYLTGDSLSATPFARPFRVLAEFPNRVQDLRRALRRSTDRPSNYEVKSRRLPVDAAAIARSLPRGDGPPRVVIFARVGGKARIVLAERIH